MNKTTSSYEPDDLRLEAQKEREAFFARISHIKLRLRHIAMVK
jgi:hypothetical protein